MFNKYVVVGIVIGSFIYYKFVKNYKNHYFIGQHKFINKLDDYGLNDFINEYYHGIYIKQSLENIVQISSMHQSNNNISELNKCDQFFININNINNLNYIYNHLYILYKNNNLYDNMHNLYINDYNDDDFLLIYGSYCEKNNITLTIECYQKVYLSNTSFENKIYIINKLLQIDNKYFDFLCSNYPFDAFYNNFMGTIMNYTDDLSKYQNCVSILLHLVDCRKYILYEKIIDIYTLFPYCNIINKNDLNVIFNLLLTYYFEQHWYSKIIYFCNLSMIHNIFAIDDVHKILFLENDLTNHLSDLAKYIPNISEEFDIID